MLNILRGRSMGRRLYRLDFEGSRECEYIWLWTDEEAIAYGDNSEGVIQIVEVDTTKECFPDKRLV